MEGEVAELFFDTGGEVGGEAGDVEDLVPVGAVDGARGDGEVGGGVHVVPPEELGAGEIGVVVAERLPEFDAVDEAVRLFPEEVLGEVAVVPAVSDDAVLAGAEAGEVGGLCGAGDGGEDGFDAGEADVIAAEEGFDVRGGFADEALAEPYDVEDGRPLHGKKWGGRTGGTATSPVPILDLISGGYAGTPMPCQRRTTKTALQNTWRS